MFFVNIFGHIQRCSSRKIYKNKQYVNITWYSTGVRKICVLALPVYI